MNDSMQYFGTICRNDAIGLTEADWVQPSPEDLAQTSVELAKECQEGPASKRTRTSYECDTCETSYSEKRTLIRHLQTPAHCRKAGKALPIFTCRHCSKAFSRDDIRRRHEREVHLRFRRPTIQTSSVGTNVTSTGGPVDPTSESGDLTSERHIRTDSQNHFDLSWGASSEGMCIDLDSNAGVGTEFAPSLILERRNAASVQTFASPEATGKTSRSESLNDSGIDVTWTSNPSITTGTVEDVGDAGGIATDQKSVGSVLSTGSSSLYSKLPLPLSRSALIRRGASPALRITKSSPPCAICQQSFGTTTAEVRKHLDSHRNVFSEELICKICQIGFAHKLDLYLHQQSAISGSCGFDFDHSEPCHGHHPPDIYSQMLTDNDRLQFCCRLRHWEQSQLRAFLDQVGRMLGSDHLRDGPERWSIGGLLTPIESVTSLLSDLKLKSTPDPLEYQGRLEHHYLGLLHKSRKLANKLRDGVHTLKTGKPDKNAQCKDTLVHGGVAELCKAADSGDFATAKRLILAGVDANAAVGKFETCFHYNGFEPWDLPLYFAGCSGNNDIVKLLIDHGTALNISNPCTRFGTPLCAAAAGGVEEVVATLLAHGADIDATGSAHNGPALCCAASRGYLSTVSLLIDRGANVNVRYRDFGSPLGVAAYNGYFDVVQILLKHGADPNHGLSARHGTALCCAASNGHLNIVLLLLKYGAKPNAENGKFDIVLHSPVGNRVMARRDMVELFLDCPAKVDREAGGFGNALCCAASKGHRDVVIALIANGADDSTWRKTGSALGHAAINGHIDIVDLLLDFPVHCTRELAPFGTILGAACYWRDINLVRTLLSRGVPVNEQGGLYYSALGCAMKSKDHDVIRLLSDFGARLTTPAEFHFISKYFSEGQRKLKMIHTRACRRLWEELTRDVHYLRCGDNTYCTC